MKRAAGLLAIAGLLALAYCGYTLLKMKSGQAAARRVVEQIQPVEPAPPQAARGPAEKPQPRPGDAVALLEIPRLGLSTAVVEGSGNAELRIAAGHIPGTSLPGENGNTGIAAHRDTFFRPLRSIRKGDSIRVIANGREYLYEVAFTEIVKPADVHVLYPAGHEVLTLVTCYPFGYVGHAPSRFIVRADCTSCDR